VASLADSKTYLGEPGNARSIDPTPVVSILLERRSLIVTAGEMYTSHLHGIEESKHDEILQGGLICLSTGNVQEIANRHLLNDGETNKMMRHGGLLERETRYSLTCRDVGRVAKQTLINR